MRQHVEPLPVTLDLRGHVLVLQDDPDPSTLAPLCEKNHKEERLLKAVNSSTAFTHSPIFLSLSYFL